MEEKIFENKYCKVVLKDNFYILRSKSGKYNDKYYRTISEVSQNTMIPMSELMGKNEVKNGRA